MTKSAGRRAAPRSSYVPSEARELWLLAENTSERKAGRGLLQETGRWLGHNASIEAESLSLPSVSCREIQIPRPQISLKVLEPPSSGRASDSRSSSPQSKSR